MFAAEVLKRFPHLPVEDEGRLTNFSLREHFFIRIFALARLRQLLAQLTMHGLVKFHAQHKLILMAYNQTKLRELKDSGEGRKL